MSSLERDVIAFMQLHHFEKTGKAIEPVYFHDFAEVIYNKFPKAFEVRANIQSLRSRIDDQGDQ